MEYPITLEIGHKATQGYFFVSFGVDIVIRFSHRITTLHFAS